MWLCLLWSKLFESTFENTQLIKVKQMQPMWHKITRTTFNMFLTNVLQRMWGEIVGNISPKTHLCGVWHSCGVSDHCSQMYSKHTRCNYFGLRCQMPPQVACLRGCKVTLVASVWLFSTVPFQMCPQSACVRGCKVTLDAFVWLFSTVRFQMYPQTAFCIGCIFW